MPETDAIKKIAKGGLIFTAGKFGATFLQFFSGLIVIHAIDKAEYGLLSLGQVWVSIAVTFSSLGLGSGLPRIIAQYTVKKNKEDLDSAISASLFLVTGISILASMGFLAYALWINCQSRSDDTFPLILTFFSFMIIPTALINTLCAIFRGVERIEPEVIYNSILPNILKILLLGIVIFLGMKLKGVLTAHVLTIWITFFLFMIYSSKHLIKKLPVRNLRSFSREVFLFSLPLMGIQVMGQLMTWVPMLMLGHFHLADEVGLFSAPSRLTALFPIPLLAVMTLYLPIATRHYEENQIERILPIYETTTKWSFLLILPVSLFSLLDAQFITITLFGEAYKEAAPVLAVLTLGSIIHSFLGPNGMTLISCGNRKIVFWATVFSTCMMIAVSIILIPLYGALGAAIAYTTALSVSNICISILLYVYYRIHPFCGHYLKPVLLTVMTATAGHVLMTLFMVPAWYLHIFYFFSLITVSFFSPRLTGSLSKDDVDMLNLFKNKLKQKLTIPSRPVNFFK